MIIVGEFNLDISKANNSKKIILLKILLSINW